MNAFFVSLVASVGVGVVAALNAQQATATTLAHILFALAGGLCGAMIYGLACWIAVRLTTSAGEPGVSVRNTVLGLAGLSLVLSSPFITWVAVSAVVKSVALAIGG